MPIALGKMDQSKGAWPPGRLKWVCLGATGHMRLISGVNTVSGLPPCQLLSQNAKLNYFMLSTMQFSANLCKVHILHVGVAALIFNLA